MIAPSSMADCHWHRNAVPCWLLVLLSTMLFTVPFAEAQYSPEHPKVQQMVDRGLNYLESGEDAATRGAEYPDGGPILVGYAVYKVTGDDNHPLVKSGVDIAKRLVSRVNGRGGESKIVYEASMAAVLLATVDAVRYRNELNALLEFFVNAQKPHGGYGYLGRETGDTSQVQYVMLALWTMNEVGVDIEPSIVENTLRYLKSTLDPSGGWGYQGVVATGRLRPQEKVSVSLATAGAGATIIGGDILGFYGIRKKKLDEDDDVPDAFVRIDLKAETRRRRGTVTMSRSDTDGPLSAANRYLQKSKFGGYWYYYWRYSQERYESFVEIINNRQEKSPGWYNQGVEELARAQDADGGWGTKKSDVTPRPVSTAFSILFLIRSTQKAIGKLDEGFVFGGYQLPTDISTVRMRGDRLVSDEETSVENLLAMLEEDTAAGVQIGLLPDHLQLDPDPTQRKEQTARLSRLLVSGDYKARQIAVKLLGRTDDISVVPDLIYALTDPNDLVPMMAEESLRLLSRKLNAGKLQRAPTESERLAAEAYWKKWYLGLRPDYIFLDR